MIRMQDRTGPDGNTIHRRLISIPYHNVGTDSSLLCSGMARIDIVANTGSSGNVIGTADEAAGVVFSMRSLLGEVMAP